MPEQTPRVIPYGPSSGPLSTLEVQKLHVVSVPEVTLPTQDDWVNSIEARAINQKANRFIFSEKHDPQADSTFISALPEHFLHVGKPWGR